MIKKWILKNIPYEVLLFFFPSKFSSNIFLKDRFIKIQDDIANKMFQMYLRSDTWIESEFLKKGLYGGWEKISLQIWAYLSKNSKVIIDIGANTGTYALLARNNNPIAQIIAVEPIDINYSLLMKNIAKNNYDIRAEKIALSDKEGIATMYMLKDKLNYMTSVNDNRYKLHPEIQGESEVITIEVPIMPFSYLVQKHNLLTIDLIKLDVEGHELAVLRSMEKVLVDHHPAILIEVIGDENAGNLDKFFRNVGYKKFFAVNEKIGIREVNELWDNDHANFLICNEETVNRIPNNFFGK